MNRQQVETMFTISRTGWYGSIAIAIGLQGFHSGIAAADDFPIPAVATENLDEQTRESLQQLAQQQANGMWRHLQLKLDEMDRICDLTDAQRDELELAAKGAVEQALEKWVERVGPAMAQRAGRIAQPQGPRRLVVNGMQFMIGPVIAAPAEQPRLWEILDGRVIDRNAEAAPADQPPPAPVAAPAQPPAPQAAAAERVIIGGLGPPIRNNAAIRVASNARTPLNVEQEPLWTATLENTLTSEQQEKLAAAQSARLATQQQAQIKLVLITLDQALLLDDAQARSSSSTSSGPLKRNSSRRCSNARRTSVQPASSPTPS